MSGGQGSKWSNLKNVRTALRSLHENQDEGQPRGWESMRKDDRPPALDPPPPGRPAYGNYQQYPSDPGPHSGSVPWHSPPPPPPQGSPPLLHNQNYQGQYHLGSNPQGYGAPAPPNPYQPVYSQAYGLNQGYYNTPTPASHPQHYPAYQHQPMSSADQNYQGAQGAYPYFHNQNIHHPAGSSHSPPLPPRPDSQAAQGLSQSPNFAGPSYPPQSSGPPLGRTVTAPPDIHCKHRDPGKGLCHDCQRRYKYPGGR